MKQVLWLVLAVACAVYIVQPIQDPDLWWHIVVGRWIIAHFGVPSVDYWSEFGHGTPWRAYSWSNEVVLAWVDSSFGVNGLLTLKLLLGVALAVSLFYTLGRIAGDWFFGGLLGVFSTAACFNHFTLRPQTVTWLLLAWLILVGWHLTRSGWNWRRVGWAMLLLAIWANTHITTVLGLAALAAFLWPSGDPKFVVKVLLFGFFGTLFTPYLGGEWVTFLSKTSHPFQHALVAEFQPANVLQFSTAFLLLTGFLLIMFLHYSPHAAAPAVLLMGGVFALGGLAVVKFLPFAVIFLSAVLAQIWRKRQEGGANLGNLGEAVDRLKRLYEGAPREGLAFLVICFLIVEFVGIWKHPLALSVTPRDSIDFMEKHELPHPLLNDFGKGGYVMYRFSDSSGDPIYRVSIDGRTNVTPPEVFEEFHAALQGKHNWRDYIERVQPKTILWRPESPLTSLLLLDPEWCLVHRSGDLEKGFVLFVLEQELQRLSFDLPRIGCPSESAYRPFNEPSAQEG